MVADSPASATSESSPFVLIWVVIINLPQIQNFAYLKSPWREKKDKFQNMCTVPIALKEQVHNLDEKPKKIKG